jgi:hypothetical protein
MDGVTQTCFRPAFMNHPLPLTRAYQKIPEASQLFFAASLGEAVPITILAVFLWDNFRPIARRPQTHSIGGRELSSTA